MKNSIKAIYQWQQDAGLLDRSYDDFLESSFQIEEALEGYEDAIQRLHEGNSPKSLSRKLVMDLQADMNRKYGTEYPDGRYQIPDVDRFDKAIDAVVFAIGSMAKLGLSPQQIQRGLLVVNQANVQKLGMPVDEHGKKIKPEGFIGPEEQLQKILDERNIDV